MNSFNATGRLTRDPETRTLIGDTKLAQFGIAIPNRKKVDGEWVDRPCFFEVKVFGRQADTVERFLTKGSFVALSGRIEFEQWDDKATGAKRSKHVLIAEDITLGPKVDDASDGSRHRSEDRGDSPRNEPAAEKPARQPIPDSEIPF